MVGHKKRGKKEKYKKKEVGLGISRNEELRARAREISVKEGIFASVQSGFGDSYMSAYAISLNASNIHMAMLSSFSGLLGPVFQFVGSRLMEKYSRKHIILKTVLLQALMWLPILSLGILFWLGIWQSALPLILIFFFSLYVIFGSLGAPAWFSWMGDIVDEKHRGKYFSMRNRICGFVALVSSVTAAFALDFFKKHSFIPLGFSLLFFVAMAGRLASWSLFKKQYEPKLQLGRGYYFSFLQFISRGRKTNFGRFVIYTTAIGFATSIASPFFAVFMLRELQFSYVQFMLVSVAMSVYSLMALPLWGKFSDIYGNYELIRITSVLISLAPFLWIFMHTPLALILFVQFIAGIAWSGFNLATSNYIYDAVSPQRRALCVSYKNILTGAGGMLGALLGGMLTRLGFEFAGSVYLGVFFVSGIMRIAVNMLFIHRFREVRQVRRPRLRTLEHLAFRIVTLPFYEISHEIVSVRRIMKKRKHH